MAAFVGLKTGAQLAIEDQNGSVVGVDEAAQGGDTLAAERSRGVNQKLFAQPAPQSLGHFPAQEVRPNGNRDDFAQRVAKLGLFGAARTDYLEGGAKAT